MSDERFELQKVSPTEKDAIVRRGYTGGVLYPESYGYGQGYDAIDNSSQDEFDFTKILKEIWGSIKRHKWLIIAATVIVTFIVYVEVSRVRSTYTAFTQIEIRRDNASMAAPLADSDPQNVVTINTKMLMFDSRSLLESVILENGLDKNPRFLDVAQKRSQIDTVKSIFGIGRSESHSAEHSSGSGVNTTTAQVKPTENTSNAAPDPTVENRQLDRYVGILKAGKKVEPMLNTSALKVSFKHTDPEIARIVAAALTKSFIKENLNIKLEKFESTQQWLNRSTRSVEAQVEKAEQDLNNFTRQNGIFSLDESGQDSLTLQKLKRMQDQIGQIQRDLMTKELAYTEVNEGRAMQLPQFASDSRITTLQTKLDDLRRTETQLKNDFGPSHPSVQEIDKQIAKVEEQLNTSVEDLKSRIRADYERTKKDATELDKLLGKTQSEALQKDQAAINYSVLKQKLDSAKALYTDLLQKKNQIDLEAAQQKSNITVLRPAELPQAPDGVDPVSAAMLGFAGAFAASIGLAFLWDKLDTTVKSTGDVSRYAHLPTLGLIPSIANRSLKQLASTVSEKSKLSISNQSNNGKSPVSGDFSQRFLTPSGDVAVSDALESGTDRVILFDDRSPVAEAYRVLRTSVLLSSGGNPPKTMLFTSGQPGEGKTTTVINTAISLAHLGASVLIIDADLRKPSTHKGFNINQSHGLSTYLSRDTDLDGLIQKLHIPNLSLLPCGPIPPNPAELISSEKMKDMLKLLMQKYDHILIDSPPLMYVTDPVILSTMVDGVVLVVHGGKSKREVVRLSRQMLDNVGAKVFGAVLNNIKSNRQPYDELGYHRHYSYYGEPQRNEERVSDILKGM
jgi:capsular exopolysaccharide synthesis family protein